MLVCGGSEVCLCGGSEVCLCVERFGLLPLGVLSLGRGEGSNMPLYPIN